MKILHITPAFQHPLVRGSDRHYHFLRELSRRHEVTLLTLVRSEIPLEALEEVRDLTADLYAVDISASGSEQILPTAAGRRLEHEWRFRKGLSRMKDTFEALTREQSFDVILFHGKSVFPVIKEFEARPIVVDFCDATSFRIRNRIRYASKAKAVPLLLRYAQVRRTERKLAQKSSQVAFISRRDREKVLGRDDRSPVVPNGIDLDYWRRQSDNPRQNCLIFTGVMDYGPNEDAALYLIDEVLPLLKKSRPDVEIIIAGRSPTPALLQRGERHPEVMVTGFVKDMRTYLEQAAIFIAPMRYGSGQQNKILEAMAMELPVITTPLSQEGIWAEAEQEPPLVVAESPPAFAESVLNMLERPEGCARLAKEGRQYMEKHFSWEESASKLEQMCYSAMEGKH